jgi:LuxR family maltose regulon positive regulatory protein
VSRSTLVRRLLHSDAPLTVIVAPAGYGRTTLLDEWAMRDPMAFARIEFEGPHNDARVLVATIEEALDDLEVPARSRRTSVTRSRRGSAIVALARLVRSLRSRLPFVLVLDDLHALHSDESVEVIRTLTRHVPPGSRLVLASRTQPAVSIGRLRASRELLELGANDLAMSTSETRALVEAAGLGLAEADVEALVSKTEGWPAALSLAATGLRGETDLSVAVKRFGGDDAVVADYLRAEIFGGLSAEALEFLTRTSILERLSGPLCDAVLERRGSGRLLRTLGDSGAMLIPLDRKDEEYRCHGLLRQMLQAEQRRADPEVARLMHARASEWYADNGDVEQALRHAIAAGDTARAADMLWSRTAAYTTQGRNHVLERWLCSFTAEEIARYPPLALAAAHSHLARGELDAVHHWELAARRRLQETQSATRSPTIEAGVAILGACAARDGVVRMREDAARAYELDVEDSPWRSMCCLLEGVARYLLGDRQAAAKRLEEGARRAGIAAPSIQTLCLAQLAVLAAEREDWDSAAACVARARAQIDHYALGEYPTMALVFATSAAIRARKGRVEEARADMRHGGRLLERLTDFIPWYEAETRLALAAAAVRLSDIATARDLRAQASRLVRRMPDAIALAEGVGRVQALVDSALATSAVTPDLLTTAELRVLTYLPTHLSFREIGARLFVSANTVKTQAHAVYRKLEASSRSQAVARAMELGLLERYAASSRLSEVSHSSRRDGDPSRRSGVA